MPTSELVTLERPGDGIALVTMSHPEIQNFGSCEGISQLAERLNEAREGGARVTVLASGVPGHWFEHAWLTDLHALVQGEPTSGDGWTELHPRPAADCGSWVKLQRPP